jgi:hypothetical protein
MDIRSIIPGQIYYTVPWALNIINQIPYIDVDYACFESPSGNFQLAIKLENKIILYDDKNCQNKSYGNKENFSKIMAIKSNLI